MLFRYRNVIDIGAGCGLLSLIAAHMPGTSVVAIEENKQLYNMCLDILKKNEVTNVKVLHCYSTDIEGIWYTSFFLIKPIYFIPVCSYVDLMVLKINFFQNRQINAIY